jgi:DnaK suppressor protein
MAVLGNIRDRLFLRKQRKLLERESERLDEQYKLTQKFPEYGTSEDENVQEVAAFQERLGLQKNLRNLIKDYKEALRKIKKENYGNCEACKNEIEKGRLEAYPAATLCVSCASRKMRIRK